MKFEKKVIGKLEKCYSIAPLTFRGKRCFLIAAEKHSPCYLFDENGKYLDTVWEGPGGVMTMVQVPNRDGEFLATRCFYSPNDSKNASLVYVRYENNEWTTRELVKLPFVHRFDILQSDGVCYLVACTLKSNHEYKDDWRSPGKIYVGELSGDLSIYNEENPLPLHVLKDGLFKNHGYTRCYENGEQTGIISCESGIYQVYPPSKKQSEWKIEKILDVPGSDALKIDLDGDGKDELFIFSPFHGDTVWIYHKDGDGWTKIYEHPEKLEMLHAIDCGTVDGKKCVYFGYRKNKRELICLYFDVLNNQYVTEVIDEDCGSANVHFFVNKGEEKLLATNREIDEIALYTRVN